MVAANQDIINLRGLSSTVAVDSGVADGSAKPMPSTSVRCAILFVDVCDSVGLYDTLGDRRALEVIDQCLREWSRAGASRLGVEIKRLGDGLIIAFPSVGHALAAVEDSVAATAADKLDVRAALHFGAILVHGRDAYGQSVNLTARLVQSTAAGRIVLSGAAAARLNACQRRRFAVQRHWQLKGFAPTIVVWPARLTDLAACKAA
jgi:class 3 adenylate cyclase